MKKQKSVLTKIKTKVSTRTMLLVALGLIIVGGLAYGLTPLWGDKTTFSIFQAGIKVNVVSKAASKAPTLSSVAYSGKFGSQESAVAAICKSFVDKGAIKYPVDYGKSKAVGIRTSYCPKNGKTYFQAYDKKTNTFFDGNVCSENFQYYTQVNCVEKPTTVQVNMIGAPKGAEWSLNKPNGGTENRKTSFTFSRIDVPAGSYSINPFPIKGYDIVVTPSVKGEVKKGDTLTFNITYSNKESISCAADMVKCADGTLAPRDPNNNCLPKCSSTIKGDLNKDGKISQSDLDMLSRMSIGLIVADTERGDLDGDGKVLSSDVLALSRMITNPAIKGDLNKDGKIDKADLKILSEMSIGTMPSNLVLGDMNGDGKILSNDVLFLQRSIK